MLARTALLTAALAGAGATPAFAQQPMLNALKPCFVVAQESQREWVPVVGHGFTPYAKIDIYLDNISAAETQAGSDGTIAGSVQAPFLEEGQRTFTLRASEFDNAAQSATVTSKVTRLAVDQTPAAASTRQKVRFRGRGFTEPKSVYMHYVFAGKVRKTVRIGRPTGDCGLFSVRRRQFPFKKSPQNGVWTIQFDQRAKYDPKAPVRVPLTIRVRKGFQGVMPLPSASRAR